MNRTALLLYALLPVAVYAQQNPRTMPKMSSVSPRFQSYNVEMVEVTGGRFWKPYPAPGESSKAGSPFEQRGPVDLYDPRLRRLAAALGPAYVRVAGSGANTVFFQDSDAPAPAAAPVGFSSVLSRKEWKGVVDFAQAVDARIVTSFAIGDGTRDAFGAWTPTEAAKFIHYDRSLGGHIAAAEFVNEPTFITISGFPKNYDAAAYGRDFAAFSALFRKELPAAVLLGPSAVGEGTDSPPMKILPAADLLQASVGSPVDVFSYHFYGAASQRCAAMLGPKVLSSADLAMGPAWLNETSQVEAFYAGLRDRFAAGKPIWLSETGQAGCGGDRWASTFLDTFRYLSQLGQMAQRGVQVVIHNTLNASDYALLDPATLTPRPNYWAALLWHRTMGTTVLDPGTYSTSAVPVYAQCMQDQPGGVTLLALNLQPTARTLRVPQSSTRYTLTATNLQSRDVMLNEQPLSMTEAGEVPKLQGTTSGAGQVLLPPSSVTFLTLRSAHNPACSLHRVR